MSLKFWSLETPSDTASKLSDGLKARHPEAPCDGSRDSETSPRANEVLDLLRGREIAEDYLPQLKAVVDEELRRSEP
jgi:hypothetical protein